MSAESSTQDLAPAPEPGGSTQDLLAPAPSPDPDDDDLQAPAPAPDPGVATPDLQASAPAPEGPAQDPAAASPAPEEAVQDPAAPAPAPEEAVQDMQAPAPAPEEPAQPLQAAAPTPGPEGVSQDPAAAAPAPEEAVRDTQAPAPAPEEATQPLQAAAPTPAPEGSFQDPAAAAPAPGPEGVLPGVEAAAPGPGRPAQHTQPPAPEPAGPGPHAPAHHIHAPAPGPAPGPGPAAPALVAAAIPQPGGAAGAVLAPAPGPGGESLHAQAPAPSPGELAQRPQVLAPAPGTAALGLLAPAPGPEGATQHLQVPAPAPGVAAHGPLAPAPGPGGTAFGVSLPATPGPQGPAPSPETLLQPVNLAGSGPLPPAAVPTGAVIGIAAGGGAALVFVLALAVFLALACRRLRRGAVRKTRGQRDPDKERMGSTQPGLPVKGSGPFNAALERLPRDPGHKQGAAPTDLESYWAQAMTSPFDKKGYESPQTVLSAYEAMARSSRQGGLRSSTGGSDLSGGSGQPPLLPRQRNRDIDMGGGQSMRISVSSGGRMKAAVLQQPARAGGPLSRGTTTSDYGGNQARSRASRSGSGAGTPQGPGLQLPELPFSDWELDPAELEICRRPGSGTPWKLGQGGFGAVYKAKFGGVDDVAVKIFYTEANPHQEAAILKEVAILRSCKHDSIVNFLGACYEPGTQRIQLVMQYCAGGDLYSALRDLRQTGELSWYRRGRAVALDIARGLNYLHHHRRLVHADLKSGNVLLTASGSARLCDVGFADILDGTRMTRAAGFTFAWAAPEVLDGRPSTAKIDIYSFGVVLWEIARGLPPRRGHLHPCKVPEECPAEVEDLLIACLAVEPEERPTARQVVEALLAVQDQVPPPGAGYMADPVPT